MSRTGNNKIQNLSQSKYYRQMISNFTIIKYMYTTDDSSNILNNTCNKQNLQNKQNEWLSTTCVYLFSTNDSKLGISKLNKVPNLMSSSHLPRKYHPV